MEVAVDLLFASTGELCGNCMCKGWEEMMEPKISRYYIKFLSEQQVLAIQVFNCY